MLTFKVFHLWNFFLSFDQIIIEIKRIVLSHNVELLYNWLNFH